jgi:hypothetical protein
MSDGHAGEKTDGTGGETDKQQRMRVGFRRG